MINLSFRNEVLHYLQTSYLGILRSLSVNVVNSGSYKAFSNGQLANFVKSSKVRTIYAL